MASLVADYGTSSGSDSDSEESTQNTVKQSIGKSTGVNFLESAGDDKEDSDSDDPSSSEKSASQNPKTLPNPVTSIPLPNPLAAPSKLPSPSLGSAKIPETSVFVTPFHRAAEAKSSILEQHVKMTDTELPSEVGGKKICWNFRKGKCRFGHKCKYSHGMEIRGHAGQPKVNGEDLDSGTGSVSPNAANQQTLPIKPGTVGHGRGHFQGHRNNMVYPQQGGYSQPWPNAEADAPADEDDYLSNAKRKKRAGVADNLVPPKRAMQQLDRFRQTERPWTVQK